MTLMGHLLRLLLCMVLCGLICRTSFAAGRITTDPNSGRSTAPRAATSADARLAQKVTYEARYQSVQQIVEDLSRITGITLYAGSGKKDWQVRARKMNIFVKDVKMSDLMTSIVHTMKFKWSRYDGVIPPTYRLLVDRKAAAAADAKKAEAEKQKEERWNTRRKRWLDVIMQDGAKTDAEIDAVRNTDPVFYRVAKTGGLRGIRALFDEIPEAKERFRAGQSFRISVNKLSQNTHDLLFSAADGHQRFMQHGHGDAVITGLGQTFKPEDDVDVAYVRLDVDSFTPSLRWSVHSCGTVGYFHLQRGDRDWEICDPKDKDAPWIKEYCEREDKILDGLGTFGSHYHELENIFPQVDAYLEQDEALYPSEPINVHPDFPELEKTIKLKIEAPKAEQNPVLAINTYIASFQRALADATGLSVVSDSWANIKGEKLPDKEATLSEVLDDFSTRFNYNWDKSSSIVEFRHRKWWKNRLNQISDDMVDGWVENTRKNHILSVDDLAQISSLTYDQAEESVKPAEVLGDSGLYGQILGILDTNGNVHWLRLYSTLSSQLRALLTDDPSGINGFMLTSDQWKLAQTMFDRIGSPRSDAVFRLKQMPSETEVTYQFQEIDTDSGREDRRWVVNLPKYEAPPAGK